MTQGKAAGDRTGGGTAPENALLILEVAQDDPRWDPLVDHLRLVADVAYRHLKSKQTAELSLLLSNDVRLAELNKTYRGKQGPTNVLAFPPPPSDSSMADPSVAGSSVVNKGAQGAAFLGDIAMAYDTLMAEAAAQGKTVEDHSAHLLVHGLLHLRGYDHQTDQQARTMENKERDILAALNIADPYGQEQSICGAEHG